MVIKGHRCWHS